MHRCATRARRARLRAAGRASAGLLRACGTWMGTAADVGRHRWLREQWGGPFWVKGVMRVDEAKRAVDTGATAISVSNHGGNNLDGTPSP
ncbi:MAG: alpha-hydroxy-acid oxidizing protein [Ilumatobacteraceae bacterium]